MACKRLVGSIPIASTDRKALVRRYFWSGLLHVSTRRSQFERSLWGGWLRPAQRAGTGRSRRWRPGRQCGGTRGSSAGWRGCASRTAQGVKVERVDKSDAEADLNELLALRVAGGDPRPRRERLVSFDEVLDEWLEANGVPNYPDPGSGGTTNFNDTGIDPNSPFFQRANNLRGKKVHAPSWWISGAGPPGNISVQSGPMCGASACPRPAAEPRHVARRQCWPPSAEVHAGRHTLPAISGGRVLRGCCSRPAGMWPVRMRLKATRPRLGPRRRPSTRRRSRAVLCRKFSREVTGPGRARPVDMDGFCLHGEPLSANHNSYYLVILDAFHRLAHGQSMRLKGATVA